MPGLFDSIRFRPQRRNARWPEQSVSLSELEQQLAREEKKFADLVRGAEKRIIWANPERPEQTDAAGIYFHGFSATRQEAAPVPQRVFAELGINCFEGRLAGHGQSGSAMGRISMRDWLRDAEEAMAIGRKIGKRQILLGVSTGACLAMWLAARYRNEVQAVVLISPNFGLRDPNAAMLALPGGGLIARYKLGKTRSRPAGSDARDRFWTRVYPSKALVPLMRMVRFVNKLAFEALDIPVLMIYSPDDQLLNSEQMEKVFARLPSESKKSLVAHSENDPMDHIIVGDIVAPGNTDKLIAEITEFLQGLK